MTRQIITQQITDDSPIDDHVMRRGVACTWVAFREDAYDWEPRGYGMSADEAERNLVDDKEPDYWDSSDAARVWPLQS